MAVPQFLVEVKVTIYTGAGTLVYQHNHTSNSFDIEFSIPFSDDVTQNVSQITIYNMSSSSFSMIHQGDRVVVEAGYQGDTGIILDGTIFRPTKPTKTDGDVACVLRVIEGQDYTKLPNINMTFAKGTKHKDVLSRIASKAGINLKIVSMPNMNFALTDSYTADGAPIDCLSEIASEAKTSLYYDHGQLKIRWLEDNKDNQDYFLLSRDTGLLQSPEMSYRDEDWVGSDDDDKKGHVQYDALSILNYHLGVNSHVQIVARYVSAWVNVMSGEHDFDGNTGTTTIEAVANS